MRRIEQIFTATLTCKANFPDRKVILFSCTDTQGNVTWAEASPLAGRNRETPEDVLDALHKMQAGEPLAMRPPSLDFALDTLDLPPLTSSLPICRLLCGSPKEILEKATLLAEEGATSVKVKIANVSLNDAISLIKELKKLFQLRIDVNKRWTLEQSLEFARHFSPDDPSIAYFEEPLKNFRELEAFPLPFALDESLTQPYAEEAFGFKNLRALVLKPTVLGGINACLHWINLCKKHNRQWVIGSAFESGIGTIQLAKFSMCLPSPLLPGLDSYSYLERDLLVTPLKLHGSQLLPSSDYAFHRGALCTL